LPEATSLAAAIKRQHGAEATLIKGDNGVFEVQLDGRLIFSKKTAGRFPSHEEILAQLH